MISNAKLPAAYPHGLVYLRDGSSYIAFDPARGAGFSLNKAGYVVARRIFACAGRSLNAEERLVAGRLRDLEAVPLRADRFRRAPPLTQLVLLLTNDCSMRCLYCYASAGRDKTEIPTAAVQSAVDYVVQNVVTSGLKRLNLSFHGGGEPTVAWHSLLAAHSYAQRRCHELGLDLRCRLTSNGLWTESQGQWIAAHMDSVLLSVDGPDDVMSLHRPTVSGAPSIPVIRRAIDILHSHGLEVRVRATVSGLTVERLPGLVEWFATLGATRVQLEPLSSVGRARASGIARPSARRFCSSFTEAYKLGLRIGCRVMCSYLRPFRNSGEFCGALGRVFVLSPQGCISTCHRVASEEDVASEGLAIGALNRNTGIIAIDEQRLAALTAARCKTPAGCVTCPAKYSCCGGCYAQNAAASGSIHRRDRYRCAITRTLTTNFIRDYFHDQTCAHSRKEPAHGQRRS